MPALIRPFQQSDIENLVTHFSFPWSTVEATRAKWIKYYNEHKDQVRTLAVIEMDKIVGYGSLLRKSKYFDSTPEIHDLWIAEEHRQKGLGKQLIAHFENQARTEGYRELGVGVGLYKDYGPAQKLYFHMGFQPDGNGITYACQPVKPGEKYPVDDDLILWLTKSL